MEQLRGFVGSLFVMGMLSAPYASFAQTKGNTIPDAKVEADVLKALAANPKLADQAITSNTVYGTVTLSGSVRDEESRKLAESIVSRTGGVQKVVDELTLGSEIAAARQAGNDGTQTARNDSRSNPLLQSDGTPAPAPRSQVADPYGPPPSPGNRASQPEYNDRQPASSQQPYGQPYPAQGGQSERSQGQARENGPYGPPPTRRPYGQPPYPPQAGYGQANPGPAPYGAQPGGQPVLVPNGTMVRIRINQGLDSQHTQPGTVFDAVVVNDVVADGFVAIPRGASVQGTVVDAQRAGVLKGRGELALQLTEVTLAGRRYPLVSDVWSNAGGDKTVRTVNSALGLGAVGAIIGGVAGGGAGAAIGAGVGGAAGVGASAASGGGQAYVPSEAILIFHLRESAAVTTVSQAEMDRLGYGIPAGSQQPRPRYVRPPVPYGYPVYYGRYYPRPYPGYYPYRPFYPY